MMFFLYFTKNLFRKEYFVFGDLELEINKKIAKEFQRNFDEFICLVKMLDYKIIHRKKNSHISFSIYSENKNLFYFNICFDKNKIYCVAVGFPIFQLKKFMVEKKEEYINLYHKKKYHKQEMSYVLQIMKKMLLEI